MPSQDQFTRDFVNSMQSLDFRKPKDAYDGMNNMRFAMAVVFERLAAIDEQLSEENDELESLREAACALADHVVAGRTAEALELAQVVLSWYEDEKEPTTEGAQDATRPTTGIEEQAVNAGVGAEKPSEGNDVG